MRTAKELYEFTLAQSPKLVADILDGVHEHMVNRCEGEAEKGSTHYTIYLKKGYGFIKELLLDECIKMVKDFEDAGYKITIEDTGNGYYVDFEITVSWDGKARKSDAKLLHKPKFLYDTDYGINKPEV